MNRREFTRLAMMTAPAMVFFPRCKSSAAKNPFLEKSFVNGIQFGVQPYSYHDIPPSSMKVENRAALIQKIKKNGFGLAEIHATYCEPSFEAPGVSPKEAREKLRAWRISVPDSYYQNIRKEFDDAGISILNYYVDMDASWINNDIEYSDEEVDATFKAAKILGAGGCVGSEGLKAVKRLAPFAEKHGMYKSVHNHSNLSDLDGINNEQSFINAFAISPNIKATFDTRHFNAANGDCLDFIKKHHKNIINVHLGNRKKNQGRSASFEEGDTPIADILRLIRDNEYNIPVVIEFEHGTFHHSTTEVGLMYDYCKRALAK